MHDVELVGGATVSAMDEVDWVQVSIDGEPRWVSEAALAFLGAPGAWRAWKPEHDALHQRRLQQHRAMMAETVSLDDLERPALALL